jgi:hypothetical protein
VTLNREQFPHWSEQSVVVEGRSRPLSGVHGGTWYHASDHDIEPGDTVEPGRAAANHKQSPATSVSVSSDRSYARNWGKNVYEVEPHGEVLGHRVSPADYGKSFSVLEARVSSATVKQRLQ